MGWPPKSQFDELQSTTLVLQNFLSTSASVLSTQPIHLVYIEFCTLQADQNKRPFVLIFSTVLSNGYLLWALSWSLLQECCEVVTKQAISLCVYQEVLKVPYGAQLQTHERGRH